MNSIRSIQALNKRELEAGIAPSASWHRDFADTAFIYIGGLPFELSEGDIITIFSQFGEPVYANLVRDRETGKSKGFAFLKYEDQRSCDLAVDNLGGATVMGRVLRVDHTRYKKREDEVLVDNTGEGGVGGDGGEEGAVGEGGGMGGKVAGRKSRPESEAERPVLKEERELADLLREHDQDDPMKEYLVQQKQEEVAAAVKAYENGQRHHNKDDTRHRGRHHHHRSRKDRNDHVDEGRDRPSKHSNYRRSPPARPEDDPVPGRDGRRELRNQEHRSTSSDAEAAPPRERARCSRAEPLSESESEPDSRPRRRRGSGRSPGLDGDGDGAGDRSRRGEGGGGGGGRGREKSEERYRRR